MVTKVHSRSIVVLLCLALFSVSCSLRPADQQTGSPQATIEALETRIEAIETQLARGSQNSETRSTSSASVNATPSDVAKVVTDALTQGDLNTILTFYSPDKRQYFTDWAKLTGASPPTDYSSCKGVSYELLERNISPLTQVIVVFAEPCIEFGGALSGRQGSQIDLGFELVNNRWYLFRTVNSYQ